MPDIPPQPSLKGHPQFLSFEFLSSLHFFYSSSLTSPVTSLLLISKIPSSLLDQPSSLHTPDPIPHLLYVLPTQFIYCGLASKESTCNVGDLGSIPDLERSPGEGKGYLLQYSGLENVMGPWGHKELDMTGRLSLTFMYFSLSDLPSILPLLPV